MTDISFYFSFIQEIERILALMTYVQGVQKGVARMLAPNGQPRKMPAAILAAGNQEALRHFTEEEEAGNATDQVWTISSATRSCVASQSSGGRT